MNATLRFLLPMLFVAIWSLSTPPSGWSHEPNAEQHASVRQLLKNANAAIENGDMDAFSSHFTGSEAEVKLIRTVGNLLASMLKYRRTAVEVYGEDTWNSVPLIEIFQGLDALKQFSGDAHIFFAKDAALVRVSGQPPGFLVVRKEGTWKIDAKDWIVCGEIEFKKHGQAQPITSPAALQFFQSMAQIFDQAAGEEMGAESKDLKAALNQLNSRLARRMFQLLYLDSRETSDGEASKSDDSSDK